MAAPPVLLWTEEETPSWAAITHKSLQALLLKVQSLGFSNKKGPRLMIVKVVVEVIGIKGWCLLMWQCMMALQMDRCHPATAEVVMVSSTLLDPNVKLLPICLTALKTDLLKMKEKWWVVWTLTTKLSVLKSMECAIIISTCLLKGYNNNKFKWKSVSVDYLAELIRRTVTPARVRTQYS